jgi:hypothetical protein
MAAARTRTRAEYDLPEQAAAPRIDAWTGMLIVSFAATLIGLIFVFLDYNAYPESKPNIRVPPAPAATAPATPPAAAPNTAPAPAPTTAPGGAQPKAATPPAPQPGKSGAAPNQ